MTSAVVRPVLRATAILIAIAGVIDPAWSISRPAPQQLVVIPLTSTPAGEIEQRLQANLRGWRIVERAAAARVPCAPDERCLLIADGSLDADLPRDVATPISLMTVTLDDEPNVALRSVTVSAGHESAAGIARVELSGAGVEGRQSEIRMLDGEAVVGSASHRWTAATTATLEVPWWPIESGARTLRVEAVPIDGERSVIDNHVDVGVSIEVARSPVLVFDARPSWSSTFVRRAIEDDARFVVGYRARLAPAISAGTARGRLDAAALDTASVVVVGGVDALTAGDVTLLEQFVTARGGTLVLLPERVPAGPSAKLFHGSWTEHLTATAETVGDLHATEILRIAEAPPAATIVARSGRAGSIVAVPSGQGRIVVAGAMDAWRYRQLDAGAFDRFWRSLVATGASRGAATQVTFDRSLGARGSRVRFSVRDRRMAAVSSSVASAIARCGSEPAVAVRLWPAGPIGEYAGEVALPATGACAIEAVVDDRRAVGSLAVAERPLLGLSRTLSALAARVTASGGVVVPAGDEPRLGRVIASAPPSPPAASAVHPMQSAWWILPFAGCLSVEWWLRRRNGLR